MIVPSARAELGGLEERLLLSVELDEHRIAADLDDDGVEPVADADGAGALRGCCSNIAANESPSFSSTMGRAV